MNLLEALEVIETYRKSYKNFIAVIWNAKSKKNIVNVTLKDGTKYNWGKTAVFLYPQYLYIRENNLKDYFTGKSEYLRFKYKDKELFFKDCMYNGDLFGVFVNEDYKFLNVRNCDVIDIGMNIGDSSIYFSLNGARKVVGLEPYPYSFSSAEKNIKLNNIKNIIALNAGYGKDSKIIIDTNKKSNAGSDLTTSDNGKEVLIYSLKTLLDKYEIENAVLKMDCEGCEYNLLYEEDDVLRRFNIIQIEYHYGYEKLKEKLKKCGFNVTYTKPKKTYGEFASNPNMMVGWIYARLIK